MLKEGGASFVSNPMAAMMALAAGLDLGSSSTTPQKLQDIAQQVEDRLVALADVIP